MKKRFKRMLAMALLAALILSSGVFALAEEDPVVESGSETGMDSVEDIELEVSTPPPKLLGFDLRSVYVSPGTGSSGFTVTILGVAGKDKTGKYINYGIAGYDPVTKLASDLPGQSWQTPNNSIVTFNDVTSTYIVITSSTDINRHPAEYYNSSTSANKGVKFKLPEKNLYNQMEAVPQSNVTQKSGEITIKSTNKDRVYAAFDTTEGKLVTGWQAGTAGELILSFEAPGTDVVLAVTRVDPAKEHFLVPVTPVVEPGADLAYTQPGFDRETGMARLTITLTDGFEYAVANEDGKVLNLFQRVRWQITAETEDGINVMPDETDFYRAPPGATQIRFRVPPGGKYKIVTRVPEGLTSRVITPYETLSADGNVSWRELYDKTRGVRYRQYHVEPASPVAEYAVMNTRTRKTTQYYSSTTGVLEFYSYVPYDLSMFVARPISLTPGEGTPSPGQGSPTRETMPPVLNKPVIGAGETQNGQRLTAETWDFYNSPFESGSAAVEDALNSVVGKTLDPQNFSGAALATVAMEPFTMIVLYDWDGKPNSALYFYDGEWYLTEPVDLRDGTYMVNFKDGINGYIDFADSAG